MKRILTLLVMVVMLHSCGIVKIESGRSGGDSTSSVSINKDITGDVPLAFVWGQRFAPPRSYPRSIPNLENSLKTWTKLKPRIEDHLRLESPDLFDMPIIFLSTEDAFELTTQEIDNLKDYLEKGGMIFLDNPLAGQDNSRIEASYRKMIKDILGSARFEQIPNNHEIYHSFFDFDGPPIGSEYSGPGASIQRTDIQTRRTPLAGSVRFLEGIWVENRLAVILSNKGYVVKWNEMSNPQLKLGVNLVVYALNQKKGIATAN